VRGYPLADIRARQPKEKPSQNLRLAAIVLTSMRDAVPYGHCMTILKGMLIGRALPLVVLAIAANAIWTTPGVSQKSPEPLASASSTAERVSAGARPRLLQVRTLVAATGQQSSIGSGFLVSADGLAVTNYHVVSQYGLDPSSYRLEYAAGDGTRGGLQLLAIDVINDLAVVRADRQGWPHFEFDDRALKDLLPNGERLYALGNPHDLGFTIVEGTYNGLVKRRYNEQIHFTGALNPGMSGGPTLTSDLRVAGINVARRTDSQLVSFLVPARFAVGLIDHAKEGQLSSSEGFRAEISRQLILWQATRDKSVEDAGLRTFAFGPYQVLENAAPWFNCWSSTNANEVPRPRASVSTTTCTSDTNLYIASDLVTGLIWLSHDHVRSVDLNQFQFGAFLANRDRFKWRESRRWHTQRRCHESFVAASPSDKRPQIRAQWCARAYRGLDGLYDMWFVTVTQNSGSEALLSRLYVEGVSYESALKHAQRFLSGIQVER
jgi:serine protease Do